MLALSVLLVTMLLDLGKAETIRLLVRPGIVSIEVIVVIVTFMAEIQQFPPCGKL